MIDFSQMEFEERAIKPGWREIRIIAPVKPGLPPVDTKVTGNEARKRLIRYILVSASSFIPHLAKKFHRTASQLQKDIDDEKAPN